MTSPPATMAESNTQEALQVNMTYDEWLEMASRLSGLAYEIDELKETIAQLKAPDPNETAADAEKRLADVKEAEERLVALEAEYEEATVTYLQAEVPPNEDEGDQGEQFDFGESAADW